ncbi:MAG: replication initiator protein [Microvirus sp.]|nr:MAG: replication initiator protein [Microvirus sp.]
MACLTPISLKSGDIVPCGLCPGCMQRHRNDWAIRLDFEALHAVSLFFVTFTYDEKNESTMLDYNHLKCLWKRVRKNHKVTFRYFAVGEYGEINYRPHFHALLFFDHMVTFNEIYEYMSNWTYGFIKIGTVTKGSIRYMLKDMLKERLQFEELPKENRPAIRVSKGMGISYIENFKSFHRASISERNYIRDDGKFFPIPRYYSEKLFSKMERKILRLKLQSTLDKKVFDTKEERLKARGLHYKIDVLKRRQESVNHFNKKL